MTEAMEILRVRAEHICVSDEVIENGLTYPIIVLARENGLITVVLDAEPKHLLRRFTPAAEIDVVRAVEP